MEGTDLPDENSNRNKARTYQMKKVTNGAQTYQIKIGTINERDTGVSNENGNESGTVLPNENRTNVALTYQMKTVPYWTYVI